MALPPSRDGDLILRPKRRDDVDAITAACQDRRSRAGRSCRRRTAGPAPRRSWSAAPRRRRPGSRSTCSRSADTAACTAPSACSSWTASRATARSATGWPRRLAGAASRAARYGSSQWAPDELGLTRIAILPHKDNLASRRVAEKAGFRETGELAPMPRGGIDEPVYAVYVLVAS